MYGGLLESQSPQLALLSTTLKPPPSHSSRRCYSNQELLDLRDTLDDESSLSEAQRLKLGPVFCSKAGHRWALRMFSGVLASERERHTPALTSSPTSSPSSGPSEYTIHRAAHSHGIGLPSHHEGAKSSESTPIGSFERDMFSRSSRGAGNGYSSSRRSPSPPPKRFDLANRFSMKTDRSRIGSIGNTEGKLWGNPSSPGKAEKSSGRIDNNRRSPSPLGSPRSHLLTYQKASSPQSSCPPGFGPPNTQRNTSTRASRASTNAAREAFFKSRICRGPNMSANFASRMAYRQGASGTDTNSVANVEAVDPLLTSDGLAADVMSPVLPSSICENHPDVARGTEECAQIPHLDRPTFEYTIASDISFEDFSKRLAQEASTMPLSENKHEITFPTRQRTPKAEAVSEWLTERPSDGEHSGREKLPEEDVDELQKWFGRMAVPLTEAAIEGVASPQPAIDSYPEPIGIHKTENNEQLDSTVLSFFDTIRSQALSCDLPTDTETATGSYRKKSESNRTPPHNDEQQSRGLKRADYLKESEPLESSEVERFFQLFTEGKPVFSLDRPASHGRQDLSSPQKMEDSVSSRLYHKVEASDQEGDNAGLKLLWAELAAANQVE